MPKSPKQLKDDARSKKAEIDVALAARIEAQADLDAMIYDANQEIAEELPAVLLNAVLTDEDLLDLFQAAYPQMDEGRLTALLTDAVNSAAGAIRGFVSRAS